MKNEMYLKRLLWILINCQTLLAQQYCQYSHGHWRPANRMVPHMYIPMWSKNVYLSQIPNGLSLHYANDSLIFFHVFIYGSSVHARGRRMWKTDAFKKLKRRKWAQHDTRNRKATQTFKFIPTRVEWVFSLPPRHTHTQTRDTVLCRQSSADCDKNKWMRKMTCALFGRSMIESMFERSICVNR